ncbi:MAG: hypothetical protein QME64_03935 [bacterium]|nr:hypothetical protein [bacterium]
MTKKYFFILVALVILAVGVNAAIITVNSAGGADYTTISAAITAAVADDTIRIIGVGPYDEVITVNKPLTIEGYGVRPNVCVQNNAASPTGGNDGLVITGFTGTCVLRNLNMIPSRTTPPADDAILVNPGTGPQTLNLIMEDIVVSPNNGSDAPLNLDGSYADIGGGTYFGDDGIVITSADVTSIVYASLTTVISANHRAAAANDGIICFPATGSGSWITIGPGCVFSYNSRLGVQWGGGGADIRIRGSATNRVKVIGNRDATRAGCTLFNGTADIDQCIMMDNYGSGIITITSGTPAGLGLINVSNSIIANNGTDGIRLADSAPTHATPLTINKVTFYNNVQSPVDVQSGNATSTITVTDCIIAGNGTDDISANVYLNNSNTSDIGNSALILVGGLSYTLATSSIDGVEGAGTTNLTNVINIDPQFASIDSTSPDFLNVTNFAFNAAGSGGTPLAGGARYTGAFPLILSPPGPITMNPGATKDFTASGGTNNFTWSLSTDTVGFLNTTSGATVTFSALSAGSVDLTVSDPGLPLQQQTVTINVVPTTAPLYIEAAEVKTNRFEIFE